MVIGVGKDFINLPFMHLASNEIDLKLLFRYANQYPKAIRLVSGGLINLKPLVTVRPLLCRTKLMRIQHRFALEDAVKAFHIAVDVSKGSIKCQILDPEIAKA